MKATEYKTAMRERAEREYSCGAKGWWAMGEEFYAAACAIRGLIGRSRFPRLMHDADELKPTPTMRSAMPACLFLGYASEAYLKSLLARVGEAPETFKHFQENMVRRLGPQWEVIIKPAVAGQLAEWTVDRRYARKRNGQPTSWNASDAEVDGYFQTVASLRSAAFLDHQMQDRKEDAEKTVRIVMDAFKAVDVSKLTQLLSSAETQRDTAIGTLEFLFQTSEKVFKAYGLAVPTISEPTEEQKHSTKPQ